MLKKIFFFFLVPVFVYSETINFKNGDKITGTIVGKTNDLILLNNDLIGIINIPSSQIKTEENKLFLVKNKRIPLEENAFHAPAFNNIKNSIYIFNKDQHDPLLKVWKH